MKIQIILSLVIILTLISCNNSQPQSKQNEEVPAALKDESSLSEITSKRGYDDLVESLYNELADKNPELRELENRIDILTGNKGDSLELFQTYNEKNKSYFDAANRHIEQIKDSALRDRMKLLISHSLEKYNSRIAKHTGLIKEIDAKTVTLSDLHTIIKITRTLPVIEKYQNNHLPSLNPINSYSKQLDAILKLEDSLKEKTSQYD